MALGLAARPAGCGAPRGPDAASTAASAPPLVIAATPEVPEAPAARVAGAEIEIEARTLIRGRGCSPGHDPWVALDRARGEIVVLLASHCNEPERRPLLHRCPIDGARPCSRVELPVTFARGADNELEAALDPDRSQIYLLASARHNGAADLRVVSAAFRCTLDARCAGPAPLVDVRRRDPEAGWPMRDGAIPADLAALTGWIDAGGGLAFAGASVRGTCRADPFGCATSPHRLADPAALTGRFEAPRAERIAFLVDHGEVVSLACDALGAACARARIAVPAGFAPSHLAWTLAGGARHLAVAGRAGERWTGYYVRCVDRACVTSRFPAGVTSGAGLTVDPSGARLWFFGRMENADGTAAPAKLVRCDARGDRGCEALTPSRDLGRPWSAPVALWIEGHLRYFFIEEQGHLDLHEVTVRAAR